MMTMTPARVGAVFQRIFGLRPGIKNLSLNVTVDEVTLSVTYFVGDDETTGLVENLEEFRLVAKDPAA